MTNAGADTGFRVGLARRKLFPTARISFNNYLAISKLIYIFSKPLIFHILHLLSVDYWKAIIDDNDVSKQ